MLHIASFDGDLIKLVKNLDLFSSLVFPPLALRSLIIYQSNPESCER